MKCRDKNWSSTHVPYSRHIRYILSKVVKCSHLFMVSTFPERQNSSSFPVFLVYYRPQRSCEDYLFTGICLSTGGWGCLPQCMLVYHTPRSRNPPTGADTPSPHRADTQGADTPPRYGHCCGRYASYWNAF